MLGCLLLLLVGLVAVVLFIPVRYRFTFKKDEAKKPEVLFKVTWLFHLLSLKADYIDSSFLYQIRLAGYQIFGNQEEYLKKKERKQQKKALKKQHKKSSSSLKSGEKKEQTVSEEQKVEVAQVSRKADTVVSSGVSYKKKNPSLGKKHMKKDSGKNNEKKKGISEIREKISSLPWKECLLSVKDILSKVLRHVLPAKLKGNISFGFDDPATTGYVTGIAALFYGQYGTDFSLYPNFDKKIFEGNCTGRGRIRPGVLLFYIIKMVLDKNVRMMFKELMK
ncbi:MAG: DUF2953 domain-containing protein [Eubacterium sp.]|nr:DUF2953 domain-containing protein [Eubacterium sp.]